MTKWELLIEGTTETWRLKVKGGYLYRVDNYVEGVNDDGHEWQDLRTSVMAFVPH